MEGATKVRSLSRAMAVFFEEPGMAKNWDHWTRRQDIGAEEWLGVYLWQECASRRQDRSTNDCTKLVHLAKDIGKEVDRQTVNLSIHHAVERTWWWIYGLQVLETLAPVFADIPDQDDLEFCVLGRGTRIAANLMLGPQFTLCTEPFLGCVLSWSVVSILRCVVLKTRLYYACGWECDRDRCRPQAWQEERWRVRFATPESFPQSACCF